MEVSQFKSRQKILMAEMGSDSAAVIFAADEMVRTGDTYFRFRQNSDFYYLTGFCEPQAVAIFLPGRAEGEYILFNRTRDRQQEQWEGMRAGQEGALQYYGANEAYPINEIDQRLPELLNGRHRIFYSVGKTAAWDRRLFQWVNTLRQKIKTHGVSISQFHSLESILNEMRLIKGPAEIDLMRTAAEISAMAHCRAMKHCKPGMYEYELEAELLYDFTRKGCQYPAYSTIVGGGRNGCILHYIENSQPLKSGDLVLIDAGGEYQSYAADITRTFPVNGRFSKVQTAVYEIVLAAQLAGINEIRPGNSWNKIQDKVISVLTQGLIDLKILRGNLEDLISHKAYQKFYMHNSGHWLGLDVHDVGNYKVDNDWRTLKPGMVLTVEPGLYFLDDIADLPVQYKNIGIRIEDDVLVTETGYEVISKGAPKTIHEIEQLMKSA
jgi:Xaa-Pro aminopeptidase